MSTVAIIFEDSDAYNEFGGTVDEILREAGLEEGEDYNEISDQPPPIKVIPEGTDKLDKEALDTLRKLEGVVVQVD
ncbi:hypothetical protein BDV34DRAFT_191083 [Aspergillus parasiticus]|uniref:Uncharacterized protein n=1 Tax=Aspergillus parasiticus TaxID=5067 RepID=A0A5N6DSK5_ASPPA|nr:hypothetical protein BDV34DRAFT_191083 [Aspergillus parasiticus]